MLHASCNKRSIFHRALKGPFSREVARSSSPRRLTPRRRPSERRTRTLVRPVSAFLFARLAIFRPSNMPRGARIGGRIHPRGNKKCVPMRAECEAETIVDQSYAIPLLAINRGGTTRVARIRVPSKSVFVETLGTRVVLKEVHSSAH